MAPMGTLPAYRFQTANPQGLHMHLTQPLAVLALLAAPALADCPTGADLAEGIILAQNEPFFMRGDFKATPEGFVETRVIEIGGKLQEAMALYRHGLVMTGEHSAAGHVEITYVDDLRPVFELPETGKAAISGIAKGPLGEAYVELELEFLGHGEAVLGDCTFETWTVKSSLLDREGTGASFRVAYSPELDVILSAGQIGADGNVTPAYAYQWAGRAVDMTE